MLKDFNDANKHYVVMHRGTDHKFHFFYQLPDGSTFVWNQYDVICEGRLSHASEKEDFLFPVSESILDGISLVSVTLPKTTINNYIREHRIHYRVLATHKTTNETIVLHYGEIWLT